MYSLLKAKIIQLVMKVCSTVNDWIRKYDMPNRAFLIAQRKDNQTQTMRPPVTTSSMHPETLRHIPVRADWQRKTKSAHFPSAVG